MNYTIVAYSIYLPTTVTLCIWIARSLHRNTKAFLVERFHHNEALASSTNNLIQTGFYLIALGFSFVKLRVNKAHYSNDLGRYVSDTLSSAQETIEELSVKIGSFTLILGLLLFLNFFIMLMIQRPKKNNHTFSIQEEAR